MASAHELKRAAGNIKARNKEIHSQVCLGERLGWECLQEDSQPLHPEGCTAGMAEAQLSIQCSQSFLHESTSTNTQPICLPVSPFISCKYRVLLGLLTAGGAQKPWVPAERPLGTTACSLCIGLLGENTGKQQVFGHHSSCGGTRRALHLKTAAGLGSGGDGAPGQQISPRQP